MHATEIILIPPNDTWDNINKLLSFASSVQLLPRIEFNIIFTGNYFDNYWFGIETIDVNFQHIEIEGKVGDQDQ